MEFLKKSSQILETSIYGLEQSLPIVFARKEIPRLLGNVIARGTLANLQSQRLGPPCIKSGRHTIYERESFLIWLRVYLTGGIKALKNQSKTKD